jgi:hypothetical protein
MTNKGQDSWISTETIHKDLLDEKNVFIVHLNFNALNR